MSPEVSVGSKIEVINYQARITISTSR